METLFLWSKPIWIRTWFTYCLLLVLPPCSAAKVDKIEVFFHFQAHIWAMVKLNITFHLNGRFLCEFFIDGSPSVMVHGAWYLVHSFGFDISVHKFKVWLLTFVTIYSNHVRFECYVFSCAMCIEYSITFHAHINTRWRKLNQWKIRLRGGEENYCLNWLQHLWCVQHIFCPWLKIDSKSSNLSCRIHRIAKGIQNFIHTHGFLSNPSCRTYICSLNEARRMKRYISLVAYKPIHLQKGGHREYIVCLVHQKLHYNVHTNMNNLYLTSKSAIFRLLSEEGVLCTFMCTVGKFQIVIRHFRSIATENKFSLSPLCHTYSKAGSKSDTIFPIIFLFYYLDLFVCTHFTLA